MTLSSKLTVLEIIMTEEAIDDKQVGLAISELIEYLDDRGFLLQHSEGLAHAIDADPLEQEEE